MLSRNEQAVENNKRAFRSNGFWFMDRHSSEFHLYVERYPQIKIPERRRNTISIPGRNGDLHQEEYVYKNVQVSYDCYFHDAVPAPAAASKIAKWLQVPGYWPLSDDYTGTEFYRMASFVGPLDAENHLNKFGRCAITFDCKPQLYLKSGDQKLTFESASGLYNNFGFPAKPIITIYGTGPGTLTVGDATVQIKALSDQLTLDCEMQNAYRKVGESAPENKNASIYALDFPELGPGETPISWTGGITKVEIIPRWWKL